MPTEQAPWDIKAETSSSEDVAPWDIKAAPQQEFGKGDPTLKDVPRMPTTASDYFDKIYEGGSGLLKAAGALGVNAVGRTVGGLADAGVFAKNVLSGESPDNTIS